MGAFIEKVIHACMWLLLQQLQDLTMLQGYTFLSTSIFYCFPLAGWEGAYLSWL